MPIQRLLALAAPALLVACACATGRAHIVGPDFSVIRARKQQEGLKIRRVSADDNGVADASGTSRRVSCGSVLSARAVCVVRTRGGANGQVRPGG